MQNNQSLKKRNEPIIVDSIDNWIDGQLDYSQNYYGVNAATGDEKQQIFRLLAGLRKHWLMILCFTLLVTALVVVYEAQKPDYYKAEARIQVDNDTSPAAGSVVVTNPGNDMGYFTTQLQILEGSGLLRRVVKTVDLENNEAFLRASKGKEYTVWQNVLRMFGLYKPPADNADKNTAAAEIKEKNTLSLSKDLTAIDSDQEAEKLAPYVSYLKNSLNVSPVRDNRTSNKETRLIEVEFIHRDPVIAAKLVNAIADTYVLQNLEQKVETNAAAGDFLQKRVAELQSAIRSGEERLINYGKSNQIISLDSNQNTVVQRLSDLNAKLGQAENDRITAETSYRAALQNSNTGVTAESKDTRVASLEGQLTSLRQRLDQLKTEYTEEWPEVIQVRRQIASIENELQNSRKRAYSTQLSTLEQAYREAFAREKELRNNFEKQRGEVLAQNEAAINYRIIQQEIDTNKTLLDGLLKSSRETEVILNGTPNNVRIVDRALVPRYPNGPERGRNILLALIVSLMAGVGLSVLITWLNDSVSSADDLESRIGLPVLGLIPAANRWFIKRKSFTKMLKGGRNRPKHYDMESFDKPELSESYLQLRTHLLLSTPGGPPQTILITSAEPGDGKTVTALNLARSLAQSEGKVLLIDADLRYPRLHTIIGVSNVEGLTNLLTVKPEDSNNLIKEIVQKDPTSRLEVLTAGSMAPNPANILSSREMKSLLTNLREEYAHIIIDSPPVLLFADSAILSTYVDAVTLVVCCDKTSEKNLLYVRKKLQELNAKIAGIIFNGIPVKEFNYHHYTYYDHPDHTKSEDGILHLK